MRIPRYCSPSSETLAVSLRKKVIHESRVSSDFSLARDSFLCYNAVMRNYDTKRQIFLR